MFEEKLLKLENDCKTCDNENYIIGSLGLIEIFYNSKYSNKKDIEICDRIKSMGLRCLKEKLEKNNKFDYYKNLDKKELYNSLMKMVFDHGQVELEYDLGFFTGIFYLFKDEMTDQDIEAFNSFKNFANMKLNAYKDLID